MIHRSHSTLAFLAALAACSTVESPVAPDPTATGGPIVQAGPPPVSSNNPPTVQISAPAAGATVTVGTTIQLTADFADADPGDTHTCYVDWQLAAGPGTVTESNGTGTCTAGFAYGAVGQFTVAVSIIDSKGDTAVDSVNLTVAATPPPPPPPPPSGPTAGSVKGSGRVDGTPTASGRRGRPTDVWFTLTARNSSESKGPRGAATIRVPRSNLRFEASTLTSVKVSGQAAEVHGTGRLHGRRGQYAFSISALDLKTRGSEVPDRIRIRIWDAERVVLDTEPGAPLTAAPINPIRPGRVLIRP
ncbi:MAG: hypothetical protein ACKVZ0_12060 [Gemmatimonadales bacterium]